MNIIPDIAWTLLLGAIGLSVVGLALVSFIAAVAADPPTSRTEAIFINLCRIVWVVAIVGLSGLVVRTILERPR